MHVDVWFDPGCPFTWITTRWIDRVAPERALDITWRPLSLLIKNDTPETSPFYSKVRRTRDLLRVVEAVRDAGHGDRIGEIYTEFGRRIHHRDELDFDVAAVLDELALDPALAGALDDPRWDEAISAAMSEGLELAGQDVGTPLVAIDGRHGRVGFSGPILTRLPEQPEAVDLWDAFVLVANIRGFWEIRRTRTEGRRRPPSRCSTADGGGRRRAGDRERRHDLNVVTGRTPVIADALIDDPRIAAVTFTGSNAVGETLRARVAARNVRFQGELGGKNASVVLADADLDVAVDGVVAASFGQAGQRCTATSRVIVDRAVAGELLDRLVVCSLRVGAPADDATNVGPLVSPGHRDSVAGFVERAVGAGAAVAAGGGVPGGDDHRHGCYFAPTVITGVTPDMEIWRDEVFGPVVVVREVDGLDEAIDAANDSEFGLSAAVYTNRLDAAERFVDEVDCGQIAVNTSTSGWDVHLPFGGFRRSGSAFKEQGDEAIAFYTKVKTVAIHVPPTTRGGR